MPKHIHLWIGGCVEGSKQRLRERKEDSLLTSLDMPNLDLGTAFTTGCMQVKYNTRSRTFEYKTDSPDSLKYAVCSLDPTRVIKKKCSPKVAPKANKRGASLTIAQLADFARNMPENGADFCRNPLGIKCFDPSGDPVIGGGVTCNLKKGFKCKGADCKDYRIQICCPESENSCKLFPNACSSTEMCRPLYYAHVCDCAPGFSRESEGGVCEDLGSKCKCGCSGDPHCYTCQGQFFDFMGVCRYIAITNQCPGKADVYPFVEVVTKHRPCGKPEKKVTCTEELTVRVCQNAAKKQSGDCIEAVMKTHGGVKCEIVQTDSDGWMSNSIRVRYSGSKCVFQGVGLKIDIAGSKWNSVIDKRYRDKMCGLCTAWNSQGSSGIIDFQGNEFNFDMKKMKRRIAGKYKEVMRMNRKDSTTFGDEWLWHDSNNPSCQRGSETPLGEECTEEQMAASMEQCSFFETVAGLLNTDEYAEEQAGCATDLCSGVEEEEAICTALKNFVQRNVNELGLSKVPMWQNMEGSPCKLQCVEENTRSSEGIHRQQFCGNDPEGEVQDCVCESGFKFDMQERRCVTPEKCSCQVPDSPSRMMPGDEVFNVKDCTEKYSCVDGVLSTISSGAAPEATCSSTELTGCIDGYDGDGLECSASSDSCESGWLPTDKGCIKLFDEKLDFPDAAERCREAGADLMGVEDADLKSIDELTDTIPLNAGEEVYVAGVCGNKFIPEIDALQSTPVLGSASYVRPKGIACSPSDSDDDPQCVVYSEDAKGGPSVGLASSNCRTKRRFICRKKQEDDFKWTEWCSSQTPGVGKVEEENPDTMEDVCESCSYPKAIRCRRISDKANAKDLDDEIECNVEEFFVGLPCNTDKCDDFEIQVLCPTKLDECAEGIDMCDGEGIECSDTDSSYTCDCGADTTRVIRDGTAQCALKSVCTMSQAGDSPVVSIQQFDGSDLAFSGTCSFNLIETESCSESEDAFPLSIAYSKMATSSSSPHIIFNLPDGQVRLYPSGLIKRGEDTVQRVSEEDYSLEFLSYGRYQFKTSDEDIKCIITTDPSTDTISSVRCTVSDMFNPSCGVCNIKETTSESTDDFFEKNRESGVSCSQDTGIKLEVEPQKTTPVPEFTLAAAATTTPPPDDGNLPPPPPPPACSGQPACDKMNEAFKACGDPTANKFNEFCNSQLCDGAGLCEVVEKIISQLDEAYTNNPNEAICQSLEDVEAAVKSMRDLTECAPKNCGPNMVVEYGASDVQPTCLKPNVPEDLPASTFDASCVCADGMMLNVKVDGPEAQPACIPLSSCGCLYEDQYYKVGETRSEAENCTGLVTCVSRDSWEASADDQCVDNASCNDNDECICDEGYRGDGYKSCNQVLDYPNQECFELYDEESEKTKTKCICKMGYAAACEKCVDIDECADSTLHNCGANAKCVNLPGSFKCECEDGYEPAPGDETSCVDKQECSAETKPCPEHSVCIETDGGYACKCCEGYIRNAEDEQCRLRDPDVVPPNCCVCVRPQCRGNPNGPDRGCYVDSEDGNTEYSYDSYFTAYIERCMENKKFKDADFKQRECTQAVATTITSTPGALPETAPATTDSGTTAPIPCSDSSVCDIENDKSTGEVCHTETLTKYTSLCSLKMDLCRNSPDQKLPDNFIFMSGKCPQTTRPPTTTEVTPEFIYHDWGTWGPCSATECGPDLGTQTRSRTYDRRSSGSGDPPVSEVVQSKSCSKPDCEEPTTPGQSPPTEETPPECTNVQCPESEWDPVCGKLADFDVQTYASECVLKDGSCRSNEKIPYTILYKGECKSEKPEPVSPQACGKGPEMKKTNFTGTHGDMVCNFEVAEVPSCDDLICVGDDGETDAAQCCMPVAFEEEKTTLIGVCSDGTDRTIHLKVPTKCSCVEG